MNPPPEFHPASPVSRSKQDRQALALVAGLSIVLLGAGAWSRHHRVLPEAAVTAGASAAVEPGENGTGAPQSSGPSKKVLADSLMPGVPSGSPVAGQVTAALEKIQARPGSAAGWVALGDAYAQQQRVSLQPGWFDAAANAYGKALALDPLQPGGLAGMAWASGGKHQFEISILWAEKLLAFDPDHPEAHGIIGDAAVELGDYERAFEHYQKMMDVRPDLSSLSRGAHLLWLTGNSNRAVLLMEKAIASGGSTPESIDWCRARLALMLFHQGALLPAWQALQPSLQKESTDPHILAAAGKIAAARREYEAAADFYAKTQEKHPTLEALAALGDLAAVQGRKVEAESWYEKVELLHREHRESGLHDHLGMARFLADHDLRPAEALQLALEHGTIRTPSEADTLAWIHLKNGQLDQAVALIQQALKNPPPGGEVHYHAGCIAAAAGYPVSAERHLQRSLQINPGFSLLHAPKAGAMIEQMVARRQAQSVASPAGARPGASRGLLQLR